MTAYRLTRIPSQNHREWLYQKYWIEKLSIEEIGKLCRVGRHTISRWLNKFHIKKRKVGELLRGKLFTGKHRQKISESLRGKKKTEEHQKKLTESIRNYFKSKAGLRKCKVCGKQPRKRRLLCEECNRKYIKDYMKEWWKKHPEKKKEYRKRLNAYYKKWSKTEGHKEWRKKYENNKRKTDIQFKLSNVLRGRLREALKRKSKTKRRGSAVKDLGCSLGFFKIYIEKIFKKSMTWENYGKEWELDHIIPLSKIDLKDRKQLLKVCHYTNIQPLWKHENRKKRNFI